MNTTLVTNWQDIKWFLCHEIVERMQNDIVVAYMNGDQGKVTQLQNNLVSSFAARAIAVRTVTTNKGKKTPGVDNQASLEPNERLKLVYLLKDTKGYKAKPVRRVWLSKDGKPVKKDHTNARPLGIPTMFDRSAQSLWALALSPIAECWGDRHSYGYRPYRSSQDAIVAIYLQLATRHRPIWVLEADIKGFFDNITHDWILANIPMNKYILAEWLKAGYVDRNTEYETMAGVPQGGPISPIIANIVLDGLTAHVAAAVAPYNHKNKSMKVLIVRYADDFIITCEKKELLQDVVILAVDEFLKLRGLNLSPKKTCITHLSNGFDFLGFNFRVYPSKSNPSGGKLLIKPANRKVQAFKDKLKVFLKANPNTNAYNMIKELNPVLRGWSNYFRAVVSKEIFGSVAWFLWHSLFRWAKRKHRAIGVKEVLKKYFRKCGNRTFVFYGKIGDNELQLFDLANVKIIRHSLGKNLNPFLTENGEYFFKRKHGQNKSQWDKHRWNLLKRTKSVCPVCNQLIVFGQEMDMHHILAKKFAKELGAENLVALHRECHHQVTYTKDPVLRARFEALGLLIQPENASKI
jgi:RNA-directed DNA polymerase